MNRTSLLAFAGVTILIAAAGASLATGFHPLDAVASAFEDPCDSESSAVGENATAAADPCGDGDGESSDGSS